MQAVTIENQAATGAAARTRRALEAGGFGELLFGAQIAQLTSALNVSGDFSGVGSSGEESSGSSQRARIDLETAEARRSEVDQHDTRRADPSSVRGGSISGRHERILAERVEGQTANAKQVSAAATDEFGGASRTDGGSGDRPAAPAPGLFDAVNQARPDSAPAPALRVGDPPANNSQLQPPAQPVQPAQNGSTSQSMASQTAAGSALRGAGAVADATTAKAESAAQSIGRILAGRGAAGTARPAVETQSLVSTGGERASSNGGGTADKGVRRGEQAETPRDAARPDAAGRSEFSNLIKALRLNIGGRNSSATIRLDPPELGTMKIDVKMKDDVLSVRVEASTAEARQMLEGRLKELETALREHDIHVDRLEVVTSNAQRVVMHGENAAVAGAEQRPSLAAQDGSGGSPSRREGGRAGSEADSAGGQRSTEEARWEAAGEARLDIRI